MGRELQKRKRRSSRPKVQTHNRPKKLLNPLGNNIIAQNWNKDETMSQNYRRLGLVAKLGKATGGTEARPHDKKTPRVADDPLAITNATSKNGGSVVTHVPVERDASGRIVRVLGRGRNPLNDPLNDLDSDDEEEEDDEDRIEDDGEEWGGIADGEEPKVVHQLEREARRPVVKHVRHQSEREREWLQRLIDKHGGDTAAMARDAKLNPMQQTKADIAKRLKKYKASLKGE